MIRSILSAAVAAGLLLAAGPTAAATLEGERFYVGGGINDNEIGSSDETGTQIFLGYELPLDTDEVGAALELGYWDAGDFDRRTPAGRRRSEVDGLWLNGVVSVPLAPRFDLIGRAGLDFGDDDGLMAGAGLGFDLNERLELRGEYVERDRTESIQANLLYRF